MTHALSLGLALIAQTPQTPPADVLAEPFATAFKATKLTFSDVPSFIEMKYTVDKRKQTIFIRKQPDTWNSLKTHEALGIVWESDVAPDGALLLQAFSQRYSMGGLSYETPSATQKKHRLRYRLAIPADIKPGALAEMLSVTASTSDAIESQLNPGKEDTF